MALLQLSLLFCVARAIAAPSPILITSPTTQLLSSYDYIVIGGGTSGLTVADRLSANPRHTVLTIEAGPLMPPDDEVNGVGIPLNVISMANVTRYWTPYMYQNIRAEPLTELNNRTDQRVPAARVLGGASMVNGMGWGRMGKSDHDDWVEFTGEKAWSFENMLMYYKRTENWNPPPAEWEGVQTEVPFGCKRGKGGAIQTGWGRQYWSSNDYTMQVEKKVGIPQKCEGDGDNMGATWEPSTLVMKNDLYIRSHSKSGHFDPHRRRRNWHVLVDTTATRVVFEKKKAVGVEFAKSRDGEKTIVRVKKEVVLAAGAVHSAPLLHVSGVGPKKVVGDLGVPLVADAPLVGEGLQDHAYSSVINSYSGTHPIEERWVRSGNETFLAEQWELWVANRTGWYTTNFPNRAILLSFPFINPDWKKSVEAEARNPHDEFLRPDAPIEYRKLYQRQRDILLRTHSNPQAPADQTGVGLQLLLRPLSRGYLRARTPSTFDPPVVDWRTFTNPFDIAVMIAAVRWTRNFVSHFVDWNPVEVSPGPEVQTDEQIVEWLRKNLFPSTAHPCCAVSLGGAADARGRVRGVEKVRVVDASVWPFVPGAHATQQTAYVVGERIVDFILEDA